MVILVCTNFISDSVVFTLTSIIYGITLFILLKATGKIYEYALGKMKTCKYVMNINSLLYLAVR